MKRLEYTVGDKTTVHMMKYEIGDIIRVHTPYVSGMPGGRNVPVATYKITGIHHSYLSRGESLVYRFMRNTPSAKYEHAFAKEFLERSSEKV